MLKEASKQSALSALNSLRTDYEAKLEQEKDQKVRDLI
jgi:hypothetical protein